MLASTGRNLHITTFVRVFYSGLLLAISEATSNRINQCSIPIASSVA